MEVARSLSVEHAHAMAHAVEDKLRLALPHLSDVVVHVEPQLERVSPLAAGSGQEADQEAAQNPSRDESGRPSEKP
jgi:hypothetical protein